MTLNRGGDWTRRKTARIWPLVSFPAVSHPTIRTVWIVSRAAPLRMTPPTAKTIKVIREFKFVMVFKFAGSPAGYKRFRLLFFLAPRLDYFFNF
jgi:hypothetical protein